MDLHNMGTATADIDHDVPAVDSPATTDIAKVRPPSRPTAIYLVGEHERSAGKPSVVPPERTLICINGRWHAMRGTMATWKQIVSLAISDDAPQRTIGLSVSFRRGGPAMQHGSLTPGDIVPLVEGMLFNATLTSLS